MADLLYPCEAVAMHRRYSRKDLPATIMVREACNQCDRFYIRRWCAECYTGLQRSGLAWRNKKTCGHRLTPEDKLKYVVRIGDV